VLVRRRSILLFWVLKIYLTGHRFVLILFGVFLNLIFLQVAFFLSVLEKRKEKKKLKLLVPNF
jgi:ABC-type Na+ efflux pump permease subunit